MRKLIVRTMELPPSSRFWKEIGRRDIGDQIEWDHKDYLSAAAANHAANNVYLSEILVWQNGGGKGKQPKAPEPILPPGYRPPPVKIATNSEIKQFLQDIGNI